jgi:putative tricarboxylic transport membrane protein
VKRALLFLSAITGVLSLIYLGVALTYPVGSLAQPGPGVFPIFVAILILLGSLGTFGTRPKGPSEEEVRWPDKHGWRRIAAVTAACLVYVIAMTSLGYLLSSAAVTFVVLHVMRMKSWTLKVGLAVGIGLVSYFFFATLLGVPLPQGILPL